MFHSQETKAHTLIYENSSLAVLIMNFQTYDDVARSQTSPFASSTLRDPYLVDERWYQVEEVSDGRVRIRSLFDQG